MYNLAEFDNMSEEKYIRVLKDEYFVLREGNKFPLEQRYVIVSQLMTIFGLDKNREQMTFILCNKKREISEACAGAGKTSISLIKVLCHVMFKDIEPKEITMLTFTRDAKNSLEYRLEELYSKLSTINMGPLEVKRGINIKTIGSFADELIYEYAEEFGVKVINKRLYVLNDFERASYMKECVSALTDKSKVIVNVYDGLYKRLLSLYTQIKEKDIFETPAEWIKCSSFKEVAEIEVNDLKQIFDLYEKLKRARKVIELVEYAKVASIILQDKNRLERWRKRVRMLVIDEYQDVSESQTNLFKLIFDWYTNSDSYVIVIGDTDQSIYGFRGAHTNGCKNFFKDFVSTADETSICLMSLNRRCPKVILEHAQKVISTCVDRIQKPLLSLRDGGSVKIVYTEDERDAINQLVAIVGKIPKMELSDTVIAYRNNRSSRIVIRTLEDMGINIMTNSKISDMFQYSLEGTLNMLDDPHNIDHAMKFLYRVVPKSKEFSSKEINEVLKLEKERRGMGLQSKSIFELSFEKYKKPVDFDDAMSILERLSKALNDEFECSNELKQKYKDNGIYSMSKIVNVLVFQYLKKYYLMWQDIKNDYEGGSRIFNDDGDAIEDFYCKMIFDWYTQDITWSEFKIKEAMRKQKIVNSPLSINLSTFHSLKGLEFKNVILIDLDDRLFPGYEIDEASKFGRDMIIRADDEAKRLFYVALTRSKQNLFLLVNSVTPTRYIAFFKDGEEVNTGEFDFDSIDESEEFTETTEATEIDNVLSQTVNNESWKQEDDLAYDLGLENDTRTELHESILNRWINSEEH